MEISSNNKSEVNRQLKLIADISLRAIETESGFGLYNGQMGAIIFLFHYARLSSDRMYSNVAVELLDQISLSIDRSSDIYYSDGVAGYGCGVEYLVKQRFITVDTDYILEDIDNLIHYHLVSSPQQNISIENGLTGIGKYFVSRVNTPLKKMKYLRENENRRIIAEIVDLLEVSYNTYQDILNVLNFLSDVQPLFFDNAKVLAYLRYAVDKMETMLLEDEFFGVNTREFNPLSSAFYLFKAAESTNQRAFNKRAEDILLAYEKAFQPFLNVPVSTLRSGSIKWWLIYSQLYKFAKWKGLKKSALKWFEEGLAENKKYLNNVNLMDVTSVDRTLITGLAGKGLSLMTIYGECGWLELVEL